MLSSVSFLVRMRKLFRIAKGSSFRVLEKQRELAY